MSKTMTVEEVQALRKGGHRFAGLAKGRVAKRGGMNKTEAAYAEYLDELVAKGEAILWMFEPWRFRISDGGDDAVKVWVTPDFMVMLPDRTIDVIDVKGGMVNDASIVRLKVAASRHSMFRWRIARKQLKRDGGGWKHEELSREASE